MKYELKDSVLVLMPEGRIDTLNAPTAEKEAFDACGDNPAEAVVMDCEKLDYVSSAGLRVVLKIRKAYPSLRLVNVQSDVYDVFEMTGFTEMMPIEKAFRTLSVEGCKVIGQGANGKVYRTDSDTIVKVYKDADSLNDIRRERELAKRAFILGVPTAISYEVAKVGDGYGSVFELLDARSIAETLSAEPEKIDQMVDFYVDLLKKIHSTDGDAAIMPDMKKTALSWAEFDREHLPKDIGDKLYELVEQVPYSQKMMHGDYHIKNVMLQSGEAILIDMDTICIGHPVFELGSMYNAYLGFSAIDPDVSMRFLGIPHDLAVDFWRRSLKKYLGTDDEDRIKEVEDKATIVGFMRLIRRAVRRADREDNAKELAYYKKRVEELVSSVDTLIF